MKAIGQACDYCRGPASGSYYNPINKRTALYCPDCTGHVVVTLGDWKAGPSTVEHLEKIVLSGRLSYGPYCREFERQMALLHACNHAVVSNSGTSSLQVALQALKELHGWADGDEVIVPASTFVATVNIVLHNRMTPVLADIERDYYALDPAKVQAAITPKTRCIIPVHPYGQPADMLAIMEIARSHGLKVIEDSCEAMFVEQGGGMVGSFGEIGVFSTYMAHLVTTGVGGVAVTDNPDYETVMRSLVNHGRSPAYLSIDDDDRTDMELLQQRFRFERQGHSFRITELEAALALDQIATRNAWLKNRNLIATSYTRRIRELKLERYYQVPKVRNGNGHAFMVYPLVWLGEGDKWPLLHFLEGCGIETREALPILNQPVYRGMFEAADYPNARWLLERGFYLGCHQHLTPEMVLRVPEALREYASG